MRRLWLLSATSAASLRLLPALLLSKFGKCHFRSKSFHYSHFVGKVRQFGSIVGKIESHVQELQILLFLTKVTASETENAILPKQLRTKTPIFNNLNFRKLKISRFRSKSFHYSHFVGKVRQFGSIVGKIESHVQELQILLFLTKVTASETENAILPKQLRTKTPIFNNLNFRKLVLWEIGTSKEEEFGKIAVSVFNAVSTGV